MLRTLKDDVMIIILAFLSLLFVIMTLISIVRAIRDRNWERVDMLAIIGSMFSLTMLAMELNYNPFNTL